MRKTASLTDAAVKANAAAAKSFRRSEGKRPTNKLAIVTCMDPRLNGMVRRLGLNEREVGVIHPLWVRIGHGCHCNRPTLDGIRAAGFDVTQVDHDMIAHAPPFVRPLIVGIAERPAT